MNNKIMKVLRVAISFIFLWAFFDKTFGLGFSTTPQKAWIYGNSPTTGFLTNGANGILGDLFQMMAGYAIVDWLFMMGLLGVGISILFNFYTKLGAIAGILMMAMLYLAVAPSANNPIVDEHVIYALVLALFINKDKKSSK